MGLNFIFRKVTFAFLLFFIYPAKMITNYHVILAVSSISTFLPFLISTALFKHFKKGRTLVLWWIFFAIAAITEIIVHIISLQHSQSAWISHIYTIIEYVLITIILASWQSQSTLARLMRLGIPIYVLFFVLAKVTGLENFSADTANYVTRPLAVLLLSAFAILTLQALWRNTPANLTSDYRFWMLLGMTLYYSASLVLFAFMFTKKQDFLVALFKIHAVVNIIQNVLFTIGVFKVREAFIPPRHHDYSLS